MNEQQLSTTTTPRTPPTDVGEGDPSITKETRWTRLFAFRIGVIPLPVYILLIVTLAVLQLTGGLAADLPCQIAFLGVASYTCYEIGRRIPLLKNFGAPVVLTIFLPAFLVSVGWFPPALTKTVGDFYKNSNFLYLFIAGIIVGSILNMNRQVLVRGFLKIFIPLTAASVAAAAVGTGVGTLFTHDVERTFFYVVAPIMSGGFGEGIVPLSLGYAASPGGNQGEILASMLPIVLLANVAAIILSSCMAGIGRRFPHLTGNGRLQPGDEFLDPGADATSARGLDVKDLAAGGFLAIALYLVGVASNELFGWPAPIAMLAIAVGIKLLRAVPKRLESSAGMVYKFMATGVTFPLLFAVGVAGTPWESLVRAITLGNIVTIVVTVATLMIVGFFAGKWVNLYAVDTAIVMATHSGAGGTGDIAILEATQRMALMPFAQIATRIGGAVTIILALIAYASLH